MKIKIWGVRGSIPTPLSPAECEGKIHRIILEYNDYLISLIKKDGGTVESFLQKTENFLKNVPLFLKSTYGGNTSSVEVTTDSGVTILLDAGSGIRKCGLNLMKTDFGKGRGEAIVLISHTHFDHIEGWPFFIPLYIKGNRFKVYGPLYIEDGKTLKDIFSNHMDYSYFPVNLRQLGAEVNFYEIGRDIISFGDVKIYSHPLNHTSMDLGYRIEEGGKIVTYQTDTEPYYNPAPDSTDETLAKLVEQKNQDIVEHARGSDILITDAQYTPEEYPSKIGWGHSTYEHVIKRAKDAGVKKLILFHFEPTHSDEKLEENLACAKRYAEEIGFDGEVLLAQEEMELEV